MRVIGKKRLRNSLERLVLFIERRLHLLGVTSACFSIIQFYKKEDHPALMMDKSFLSIPREHSNHGVLALGRPFHEKAPHGAQLSPQ